MGYSYPLWNGKEVVGHYYTLSRIQGVSLVVAEVPLIKHRYGTKLKTITIPVLTHCVSDDGVTMVLERRLDVRGKSRRQISILTKGRSDL